MAPCGPWRHGTMATWPHVDMAPGRHGTMSTWHHVDVAPWRQVSAHAQDYPKQKRVFLCKGVFFLSGIFLNVLHVDMADGL